MRSPFQVLIFPFIKDRGEYYYCLFKRADLNIWQAIAGGGEGDETPLEAAKREFFEEISTMRANSDFIRLSSMTTIPAANIKGLIWGNIIMIPEISFGIEMQSKDINLGNEHTQYQWNVYKEAEVKLRYDSNKSALWELDYCLKNGFEGIKKNQQNIIEYYNSK